MVVSVVVKVVEASDTGPGVIIWVFTVSTVMLASVTVVTVLILSAAVVVVGEVVVVVETGNMPAPDPSPIENFMTKLYNYTPSGVIILSTMIHIVCIILFVSGISQQNNPVGIMALFLRFRRTTPGPLSL